MLNFHLSFRISCNFDILSVTENHLISGASHDPFVVGGDLLGKAGPTVSEGGGDSEKFFRFCRRYGLCKFFFNDCILVRICCYQLIFKKCSQK